MEARIYKSTGSWYTAKGEDGKFYQARAKGVFKIEGITSTNPIAVGDKVIMEPEEGSADTAIITEILPRHNYIARQSPSHKRQHHIVAANIDQSFLICTIRDPRTSQGFIDRFLVGSEAFHVPAVLVFNKKDIYKEKDLEQFFRLKDVYENIGYPVKLVSADKEEGMEELHEMMKGKTTLFSGHSGVGKSSLINKIIPGLNLRTKNISGWSGKGLHTTTFAEMFDLPYGGSIIDTPGVREFGVIDIEKRELSHYFPEMRALIHDCQFNNCIHVNEPGCSVLAALERSEIDVERYVSYLRIMDTIEENNY
jgi:ribosome biogenesis GTPase